MDDLIYSLEDVLQIYKSYDVPLKEDVDLDALLARYTLFIRSPRENRPISGMCVFDEPGYVRFDESYGLAVMDEIASICQDYYYLSQVRTYELMGFIEAYMCFANHEERDDEGDTDGEHDDVDDDGPWE